MTDEATTQTVETPAATPDKVEMPPEIQKQFNKIYGEMKKTKERNNALEEHALKLTDALSKMQSAGKDAAVNNVMNNLRQQLREARAAGDDDKAEEIEDKITDLKVEAKLEKKIPKPQPVAQKPDQPYYELTKSEERIMSSWATEVDDDGEPLRLWAQSDKHPKAQAAYEYLTELLEDDEYADLTIKEKLALVDEKFLRKAKTTRDVNAVGGGSLTNPSTAKQDKLTDEEKRIAWRIFSKLTPQEAEKKYSEGLKLAGKR